MALISVSFNGTSNDLNDFCSALQYQATINGQANPETKVEFFQRKIKEYVWTVVRSYRINKAGVDARALEEKNTVNF